MNIQEDEGAKDSELFIGAGCIILAFMIGMCITFAMWKQDDAEECSQIPKSRFSILHGCEVLLTEGQSEAWVPEDEWMTDYGSN
jgi:hypothetical protein